MKEITELETITITKYVANDGTVFNNKYECEFYEWQLTATKVYVVSSRGQHTEAHEIYSTHEKAKKAIKDSKSHYISEIYLDERFWN